MIENGRLTPWKWECYCGQVPGRSLRGWLRESGYFNGTKDESRRGHELENRDQGPVGPLDLLKASKNLLPFGVHLGVTIAL